MEHHGMSREQAHQFGAERDHGSVDTAEAMPQSPAANEPVTISIGYLPAEQPMCPHCHTGLHPVRQNQRGDSLFECLQPCLGDGYMAVYRLGPPAAWEPFEGRYGKGPVDGWLKPVRFADLAALVAAAQAAPPAPAEKPAGAWPEAEGGSQEGTGKASASGAEPARRGRKAKA